MGISSFVGFKHFKKHVIPTSNWGSVYAALGAVAAFYVTTRFGLSPSFIIGATAVGASAGVTVGNAQEAKLQLKRLGLDAPIIQMKRVADEITDDDDEKKLAVFSFDNVAIIDAQAIKESIAAVVAGNPNTHTFNGKPTYSVSLTVREDITFGELEYTNLANLDVVVTKEGKVLENGLEKEQVLRTLGMMPKFLNGESSAPGDIVAETIAHASKSRAFDWVRSNILRQGRIRSKIDPAKLPDSKLSTDEFIEELMDVSIALGKYKDIFEHYKEQLIEAHNNSFLLRESVLKTAHKTDFGGVDSSSMLWTAALVGVGLVVATVFLSFAIGISLSAGTPVGLSLLAGFGVVVGGVVLLASAMGAWKIWKQYGSLKKIKKLQAEKEKITDELEKKYMGLGPTQSEIQRCVDKQSDHLSLKGKKGKEIGDICAKVISKWLSSVAGEKCKKITLSNNNITSEGARALAKMIADSTHIQEIDLSGNEIEADGMQAIEKSLSKNFTLVAFTYTKDTPLEIKKQLLINQYLQGVRNSDGNPIIKTIFGSVAELREAAIDKIKSANNLRCIQSISVSDVGLDVEVKRVLITRQLELMFQDDYPKIDRLAAYIRIYEKATVEYFGARDKEVLDLIKDAVFKGKDRKLMLRSGTVGMTALVQMEDSSRIDLLKRCLLAVSAKKDDEVVANEVIKDNREHAKGIAVIVSQLIGFEEAFDSSDKKKLRECVQQISTWGGSGSGEKWKFDRYIEALKQARKDSPAYSAKIEGIIQAGLQADLAARFECLRFDVDPAPAHTQQSTAQIEAAVGVGSLARLKTELESNYDLVVFDGVDSIVDEDARDYVKFICISNQLHKYAEKQDLNSFMQVYADLPDADCGEFLLKEDRLSLLNAVVCDLDEKTLFTGCKELRELNEEHCIALLEHCFEIDPDEGNAYDKAVLLSSILKIDALFDVDNKESKLVKDLSREIYRAISTERGKHKSKPRYDFKDLKKQLKKIESKLLSGQYDDAPPALIDAVRGLMSSETPEEEVQVARVTAKVPQLDVFIAEHKDSPIEEFKNSLAETDGGILLQMVQQDLGESGQTLTLDELKKLDDSHRIELLAHCFTTKTQDANSAYKKAVLLSKMLNLYFTSFEDGDLSKKLPEKIAEIIRSSISPVADDFDSLKERLEHLAGVLLTEDEILERLLSHDVEESNSYEDTFGLHEEVRDYVRDVLKQAQQPAPTPEEAVVESVQPKVDKVD
jgi:hypothetical protein